MKLIKFLLLLVAIGLGVWVLFWLIGFISSILWYVFWFAVLGLGGYVGYKLFLEKDKETRQLEDKTPMGLSEMQRLERELEEIERKYLPK